MVVRLPTLLQALLLVALPALPALPGVAPGALAQPAGDGPGSLEAVRQRIQVPEGFVVDLWAGGLPNARSMAWGDDGTLFVGTRTAGRVYAVTTHSEHGRGDRIHLLAQGLDMPNGVAFRDGSLYVAEVGRVLRYDGIEARLANPPRPVVVTDALPRDRHHGWKVIHFGPDGMLYVPVGAPCNVCLRPEPYATMLRMRPDGSGREVFARGIRNTVGFGWHPETGELWFTDNGRDWMGDDRPPDELNRAPRAGLHFGFPFVHGDGLRDPEFGDRAGERTFTPPVQELGPHVAALGLAFVTSEAFPARYRGHVLIAEHGSWNRSTKIGYRVTIVRLDGNEARAYEPFATGWHEGDQVFGRPVDVLFDADGHLLVSDDHAGAIWRIRWVGEDADGR